MSVPTLSETREYGRFLTFFTEARLPGIKTNVYEFSPLMSAFMGRLSDSQFGSVRMNGRGRLSISGESVRVNHQLGKNGTVKTLASAWDTVNTTPQDNVRFSRANWAQYNAAATVNLLEMKVNMHNEGKIASLVDFELTDAVTSLADFAANHVYDNAGSSDRLTELQSIVSANNTVQTLSGATYDAWNSRGLSARGTAPGSVSFAGGSFITTGIANWRTAYLNASEGAVQPHAIYTTYAMFAAYEGQLQPQERFTSTSIADGGFQQLAFKGVPVFPDSKCPSGETYFLNFDKVKLAVLEGMDFNVGEWHEAETQNAFSAKVNFVAQLICYDRRFVNKVTGQSA